MAHKDAKKREELREHAIEVLSLMGANEEPVKDLVALLMDHWKVGKTRARGRVMDAVPEGKDAAIVVDGRRLWRHSGRSEKKTLIWLIRREAIQGVQAIR